MKHKANISQESRSGETPIDLAGSSLSAIFDKTKDLFICLVESAGQQAVDLLLDWKETAQQRRGQTDLELKRSNLDQMLWAVIAPGIQTSNAAWVVLEEELDLSCQNLFPAPQVRAHLTVLPGFTAADASDCRVLRCIAEASNEAIFQSDAVQALVLAAWQQARLMTAWEILLDFLNVVFLCLASSDILLRKGCCSNSSLWIVFSLHCKRTVEELFEYVSCAFSLGRCSSTNPKGIRRSCVNLENAADLVYLGVGWSALALHLWFEDARAEKPLMSIFCALVWLRALYSLRGESSLGPRLLPILCAVFDTSAFILVTVMCTLAATHAYHMLDVKEPSELYTAFVDVVRLAIFSDFDLSELEGHTRVYNASSEGSWALVDSRPGKLHLWIQCFFYVSGVGISIFLMSLLVAVLAENFELCQERSSALFLRAGAKMILELRSQPWCKIWHVCMKVWVISYNPSSSVTV